MMYLHQHHAIHRDLKPGNILLDGNLEPHITDFGLAKFVTAEEANHTVSTGTCAYMAPEVIDNGQYNGKSDVYSFGILMYEVVTDSVPYPEYQQQKITSFRLNLKILTEDYRPKFTVPVKQKIRQLIEQCWAKDPKDRPTFEEIYNRLSRNIEESVYNVFESGDNEYYLDDVDTDDILMYIDKINDDDENRLKIDLFSFEYEQMKQKIMNLENKVDQLNAENISMKQEIVQLNSRIDLLTNENNQIKKESPSQIVKPKSKLDSSIKPRISEINEIKLHIKICKANIINAVRPLIQLRLKSQHENDWHKSLFNSITKNPVWNKEFDLFTNNSNDILIIAMLHKPKDDDSTLKIIDEIQYSISDLIVGGPVVNKEFKITHNKKSVGSLYIEAQIFKTVESDIKALCTLSASGNHFITQKFYRCLTCNLTPIGNQGICENCVRNCHKGHDVRFVTNSRFGSYCDCPEKCGCHFVHKANDLRCTYVENGGKEINQPIYYCTQCDKSCTSFICQNCAIKYHHGHDLVYLGIVESCTCKNHQIKPK
ncbi:hypothetical protein M9Y10_007362 [Tritrichomonas musculus]|uniref:Protein kinase domain-containing protein n=1 Tax=Tritrichomonas musculus TaxID=1915356 RepID=A0ABR2J317_9EUKA